MRFSGFCDGYMTFYRFYFGFLTRCWSFDLVARLEKKGCPRCLLLQRKSPRTLYGSRKWLPEVARAVAQHEVLHRRSYSTAVKDYALRRKRLRMGMWNICR